MKINHKIKQLDACKRLFKIEVPAEEIAVIYKEVYSHIQKEAAMAGFRKGNAPFDLIKKDYSDYAKKRVLELAVEDSYREAMKASGFLPVGNPTIENIKFLENGPLTFDAAIEIRPKVSLKNYKGLKIKRKSSLIKNEELDKALENLRQLGAEYKVVKPRPIKEGDYAVCDVEWFVDNKSIEKKENVLVPVEKNTLTADMFGGILGSVTGEKVVISTNLDKNFPKPEYVGKAAVLEVLVHQIKEKELPALDDEFAKDLGIKEGISVLREKIKERLIFERQEAAHLDMQDQALEQLLNLHSFDLPVSLVESEFKNLLEEAKHKARHYSKDLTPVDEKLLQAHAEKQVKTFFIIEEIAEKENLSATEEELDKFIEELAKRQNQKDAAAFRRKLEKEQRMNSLYWQLTEAKVMQFLLDNAKVEEEVPRPETLAR